jgi:hypothetical protein
LSALFAACTHPTGLSKIVEQHESLSEFGLDFTSTDVWLCSTAYLHDGNQDWLPRFLAMATIMQLTETHFMAEHMTTSDRFGGKAHRSQPAGRAPLTNLNHLLKVDNLEIRPRGELPSEWIGTGEFEEIVEKFGRFNSGVGKVDDRGLLLHVPFADRAMPIILNTNTPHPRFGNGVHVVLILPHLSDFDSVSALAIEMNYLEDRNWCRQGMPFMGSWIPVPDEEPMFALAFRLFVPNLFYQPGLAENLVAHAILRARWAREFLRPDFVDIPLDVIIEERKSWDALVEKQRAKQRTRGAWRTILVGGLVAGVLLLMAFFLSNNPSNPFRTRATIGTSGIDMVERRVAPWAFRNKPS